MIPDVMVSKPLTVKGMEHVKYYTSNCNGKHHTSICYKSVEKQPSAVGSHQKQPVVTRKRRHVFYPVVVILVDGIKCRALLDAGAGGSYISLELTRRLEKVNLRTDCKQIETMLHGTPTHEYKSTKCR